MNVLFTGFWGLLALSAASQLVHNVFEGLWGRALLGLLVLAWTGGNAYLWATSKADTQKDPN